MIEPIVIKVVDKVPIVASGPQYVVCDNSDYTVVWQLDEEWAQLEHRTMQVNYKDGTYERVLFTGDSCTLPAIPVSGPVHVGLFAGDIHTTRPARLLAVRSATTDSGEERDPMPNGYAQAIEALDAKLDKNQGADNAGKALVVGDDGNVVPGEAQGGGSLPTMSNDTAGKMLTNDGNKAEWAEPAQSDWNQNDSSKPDYVKNRTHYVEMDSVEVVPEMELTIEDAGDVYATAQPLVVSVDDVCTVVFDNDTYTQRAKKDDIAGATFLGNLSLVKPDGNDTGEPFFFAIVESNKFFIKVKTAGTHTIAVTRDKTIVHTLDHKFIKDMYYSEDFVEEISGLAGYFETVEGKVIKKVSVAGTIYENLEPSIDGNHYIYTAGEHTLDFYLGSWQSLTITPNDISEDEVVFLKDYVVYHPVPSQYIPIANGSEQGGVKPVAKTDAMTQRIGVDGNGGLYTEPAEVYYIDLEGNYPDYTCPVVMDDIKAAYEAGKVLECRCAMGQYTATLPLFIPMPSANTWVFSGAGALTAMNFPAQSLTVAIVNGTVQASDTRMATKDDIPFIPGAMPNPYALTITSGSDSVTYDGSETESIDIPSIPTVLPNPNALTITIGDNVVSYDGSATRAITIPASGGSGGETWELINTFEIAEADAARVIKIDKDSNGNAFSLKEFAFSANTNSTKTDGSVYGWFCVNGKGTYNSGLGGFKTNYVRHPNSGAAIVNDVIGRALPFGFVYDQSTNKQAPGGIQNSTVTDVHEVEFAGYQYAENLLYGTFSLWGVRK